MGKREDLMADEGLELVLDGEVIDTDDLTFREHREMRRILREDILEDPTADVDVETLPLSDFLPALVLVIKRRTDSGYTLDQAMDLKLSDVVRDPVANGGPPTKPAAKRRAKST